MTWKLVGYFPKRRTTRSHWASRYPDNPDACFPCSAPVEEICSVSTCIARGPEGWRAAQKQNFYDVFDDVELAWSVVPMEARALFELFAYRLSPVQFEEGREEIVEEWYEHTVEPMPPSFVRLGWDAVQGGGLHGCSPLSCNNEVGQVGIDPDMPEVNRYCLAPTEREGMALALRFSISKPEPGPYRVVEVWRDACSVADADAPADRPRE